MLSRKPIVGSLSFCKRSYEPITVVAFERNLGYSTTGPSHFMISFKGEKIMFMRFISRNAGDISFEILISLRVVSTVVNEQDCLIGSGND
jgi:hypothetical protein